MPPGGPKLPPGTHGVAGTEAKYPDPLTVDGAQCVDCAPGTRPVPAKRGDPAADRVEQRARAR